MRKNGRILFDRPKPTVGCSASGGRRRITFKSIQSLKRNILYRLMLFILHLSVFLTPGVTRQSHWPDPDLKPAGIYTYLSTDFRGQREGK
jgi:hypothetical protein